MPAERWEKALAAVCMGSVILQSAHMVEHVAQVVQKFYLLVPAHGLLGEAFDREWVHVAYNTTLEAALIVVFLGYGFHMAGKWNKSWSGKIFLGVVLLQGYHAIEHAVKMWQYYATGKLDTPGVLGQVFPAIWVHFTLNLVVLLMMVLAFHGTGLTSLALRALRRPTPSAA